MTSPSRSGVNNPPPTPGGTQQPPPSYSATGTAGGMPPPPPAGFGIIMDPPTKRANFLKQMIYGDLGITGLVILVHFVCLIEFGKRAEGGFLAYANPAGYSWPLVHFFFALFCIGAAVFFILTPVQTNPTLVITYAGWYSFRIILDLLIISLYYENFVNPLALLLGVGGGGGGGGFGRKRRRVRPPPSYGGPSTAAFWATDQGILVIIWTLFMTADIILSIGLICMLVMFWLFLRKPVAEQTGTAGAPPPQQPSHNPSVMTTRV